MNRSIPFKHLRRRFAVCILTVFCLLTTILHASSDPTPATYGTVAVYIDGIRCTRDAYIIENGVTYLPLRALAEALLPNAVITWDPKASHAVVQTDDLTLTAKPGEYYITANGRYLALSGLYPAKNTLVGGVTYVPLRTAVRAMGGEIHWNAASNTITPMTFTGCHVSFMRKREISRCEARLPSARLS